MVNTCRPDDCKSCAACCGLYNVLDATRPTLLNKLQRRTLIFREVDRTADEITEFAARIRNSEALAPLDEAIHVCEFVGFVDGLGRSVGCILHPSAPGNRNVDLRGLCHYGSVACKSFYCPAWHELPPDYRDILLATIDDWHLYGLVVTDLDFVLSLVGLVEDHLGCSLDRDFTRRKPARDIFLRMLHWKDTWPFKGSSVMRRSRYYFKGTRPARERDRSANMRLLLDTLSFTFGIRTTVDRAEEFVMDHVDAFAGVCSNLSISRSYSHMLEST